MSDLSTIHNTVLAISTREQWLENRQKIDFAKGMLKTLDALLEEKGLEIIEATGPISCGDLLYVISHDSSYKAKLTPREMAEGIMLALGGDWESFALCLASGAIKHGQLRKLLEQNGLATRFDEFFDLVEKKTVKGEPVKRVSALNTKFLKSKPRECEPTSNMG